jgi:hypothetical protein
MIEPPKPVEITYNKTKFGYFGELGTGAHAHLRFIQTALSVEDLDSVTLIENIPGSETWDVRDLFQRDVDKERVTNEILPYLKDPTKVKFFNPLTLALLPLASSGQHIHGELPYVVPRSFDEQGHAYTQYEWDGHYKFDRHVAAPAFSRLSWNDSRVRVVAIDGQHRLSALKRWKNEPPESSKELATWTIPVVILGVFRTAEEADSASFLDVVRKTFVYINNTAQQINPARKTLLNDESVSAVCTQELIQDSHANDCLPIGERDNSKLPLLMFDWRGESQNGVRVCSPGALKTVEELHDWFGYYIIGEDGTQDQALALGLDDLMPPLTTFGPKKGLSHGDSDRVRKQFRVTLLPGMQFLFQNLSPYSAYIVASRKIEADALHDSDLAQHAFMKLRFGTHRASEDIMKYVEKRFEALVQAFGDLKSKTFEELLSRDIGMRGLMSAFGAGKYYFDEDRKATSTWLDYSKWFTPAINRVYDDGWFRSHMKLDLARRRSMTHVVFDQGGSIVNYKIEQVQSAFGALCLYLVVSANRASLKSETVDSVWDDCSEDLRGPLKAGYRRQCKAELLEQDFKGTQAQFKEEVQKRATGEVEKHLKRLKAFVEQ